MKKMVIQINGQNFEVPTTALRTKTYGSNSGVKYVHINAPIAGSLVKQFVKMNYSGVMCSVKSDSFSGGNSLRVNLYTKMGAPVDSQIAHEVEKFAHLWEYGTFNGMHDIYESYETSGSVCGLTGMVLEAWVKYVFVDNQAPFGKVEWVVNEVVNVGREFNDTVKYVSDQKVVSKAFSIIQSASK